jgi:hypothetical protein
MEYLTLNCRGDKILIDNAILQYSEVLRTYMKFINNGRIAETKNTEYYVNCTTKTMHELLDLLPDGETKDRNILRIADFLGFNEITEPKNPPFDDIMHDITFIQKHLICDLMKNKEASDKAFRLKENIKYVKYRTNNCQCK